MRAKESGVEPVDERTLAITRVYDAPARLLFTAWSKPEHIKKWFGPVGWPVTMAEMDFRVGGRWRFAMTGPDGKENPAFGGTYLEIVPHRRLVFDNAFELPGSPKMIMTVTFDEMDGRTTLTHHTLFASIAMKQNYTSVGFVEGTNSGFDQLADVVAAMG
jgi:uncharacterized protein YndB with AHSA1/START domain